MGKELKDKFNRVITYLRISVTDRCNLRCRYCMPEKGVEFYSHDEILRYEEIEKIIDAAVELGMKKVRFTGGEPFVRRGFVEFLTRVHKRFPDLEIALTTNGVLLGKYVDLLKNAGVSRLNVSMDTLIPEKYRYITRVGKLGDVLHGIDRAIEVGFEYLRINVVAMKGFNTDELFDFVDFTAVKPVIVRFIEFMPLGGGVWNKDRFVSAVELRKMIEEKRKLHPLVGGKDTDGPAVYYKVEGAGIIGFIAAMTEHFCERCNRLRLTSIGQLRPCLFSDRGVDLRAILRGGGSKEDLMRGITEAVNMKPAGWWEVIRTSTVMSRIGG